MCYPGGSSRPPAGHPWGASSGSSGRTPKSTGLGWRRAGPVFRCGRQHHLGGGRGPFGSRRGMLNTERGGSTGVYIQELTAVSNARVINFSDHPGFRETWAGSPLPQRTRSQEFVAVPTSPQSLQEADNWAVSRATSAQPGAGAAHGLRPLCIHSSSWPARQHYFTPHYNIYVKLDLHSYSGEIVLCKQD